MGGKQPWWQPWWVGGWGSRGAAAHIDCDSYVALIGSRPAVMVPTMPTVTSAPDWTLAPSPSQSVFARAVQIGGLCVMGSAPVVHGLCTTSSSCASSLWGMEAKPSGETKSESMMGFGSRVEIQSAFFNSAVAVIEM